MKRTTESYWKRIFEKMQRDETSDFIYRRWFGKGGFYNFKIDLVKFPSIKMVIEKIDKSLPFSPTNYEWIVKPTIKRTLSQGYAQKNIHNCCTLTFYIKENSMLNNSGVYKITFDNGCFYLGSTRNFRKRVSNYVSCFNGTSKMNNKKMIQCVAGCTSATFEIVEYVEDLSKLIIVETRHIQENIGNTLLLNRAHDASSNKGIKWTDEEKRKTKESLIEKYKIGFYIATAHKYKKSAKKPEELFKSKCFGDK